MQVKFKMARHNGVEMVVGLLAAGLARDPAERLCQLPSRSKKDKGQFNQV